MVIGVVVFSHCDIRISVGTEYKLVKEVFLSAIFRDFSELSQHPRSQSFTY